MAATLTTLYYFQGGSDGAGPSGLALGSGGVLYGVTGGGATSLACPQGCGTVFSLTPTASAGGAWTKTGLYSFSGGSDGNGPSSAVLIGPGGTLYGTTFSGGAYNAGTVYALKPPSGVGGPWTESVLYSFTGGMDGGDPGGIALAGTGVLYGTARSGGSGSTCASGCGVVFSLTPPASPNAGWAETVLYSFLGASDGYGPNGIAIGKGPSGLALYGPTIWGGSTNNGTVFSMTPPASAGGAWSHTVLASLNSVVAVITGAGGVLYGTTIDGGSFNGGSTFSLTPPALPGGAWTLSILHSFQTCPFSSSCDEPTGLYFDKATGALYGLTIFGGANRAGSIYSLTPPTASGASWTYSVTHSFTQSDGADPDSLVLTNGLFYGATAHKGTASAGTVFSLRIH